MYLVGVGIDLVDIKRIENIFKKDEIGFCNKVFLEREVNYCKKRKDFILCFAARFAAKEAVSKSLGCGICDKIGWHDIEVMNDEKSAPFVNLSARSMNFFENENQRLEIKLSLTHTKKTAGAVAIATLVNI